MNNSYSLICWNLENLVPYFRPVPSNSPASTIDEQNQSACPVCLTNTRDLAFGCGHMTCRNCGSWLSHCPLCRVRITSRLRVYNG
ncbi:E3 ubiquitin-protein ligase RGLG4-like [Trifolium pratense]|uniref:E3 ubiquitin-protein ligase RGLG4-like n=1 Tax=Trifolium pratense TaxID=57577 RepID=UPI001E69516F|nr:E3 ubiquitin-protein ligase RGLG4-like [Trifolium pratense]